MLKGHFFIALPHICLLQNLFNISYRGGYLTAMICAACTVQGAFVFGVSRQVYALAYVAALSTRLAHTCAGELGNAYGKHSYMLPSLEKVPPGTPGAISTVGTISSLGAAVFVSLLSRILQITTLTDSAVASMAAFIAVLFESILFDIIRRKVNSDILNFVRTLLGSAIAAGCALYFGIGG